MEGIGFFGFLFPCLRSVLGALHHRLASLARLLFCPCGCIVKETGCSGILLSCFHIPLLLAGSFGLGQGILRLLEEVSSIVFCTSLFSFLTGLGGLILYCINQLELLGACLI